MFNYFPSIKSSDLVEGFVSPEEFLYQIKSGEDYANKVLEAREIYKSNKENYTLFKQTNLPCYSLNFTFNKIRSNDTINEASGYIYLDIDNNLEIELGNPLIFASWVSLSGHGRGVLVKVNGLNKANFSYTYNEISRELSIHSDNGARKATQVNVLSYDPDLYLNNTSNTFLAISKKDQYSTKKTKKTIGTVMGSEFHNLRFDNLDELIENIEFDGEVIYDFKQKIKYADAYIPFGGYQEGYRNNGLCGYAYQVRALNPKVNFKTLYNLLKIVNQEQCHPPLHNFKIRKIVESVMEIKNFAPIMNKTRRFVYNKDYQLNVSQRKSEMMRLINAGRTENSKIKIENAIYDWDFETMGKITQKGIRSITGLNLKTIKKYYPLYKSDIKLLNDNYAKNS
ncbi:hypothetical protein APS56_08695 [Pseudalgibacter alginicilyticus]|uniref:Uncharacterized protein n=2 Tax=Pseudalgibacter alginicilyticus TaxID=1736674 RepID=A0A0P0CG94_9FLAO|nr:hypothetical protein APS56_08695 [Pseudalgibacter alginicilyticus]